MAEQVGTPLSMHDPRRVGPWTVHSRLGAGGMGVVYYATSGGQAAAVKVIRPGLLDAPATRERFGREVAILRSVRDLHISQFLAADLATEPAWLAIEYISGPVLREEVAAHGPLSEEEWWDLARGLSQALAVLEVHRVTHRDIKPGNVILNERGPVLIDFGIAHPEDATSLTATGLVTGSPAWLSPEQANLEPTGPASDVFCLGSLLAFAATGRPPFGEGASVAVLVSIATRDPDLAGVDPDRALLLRRMLAKDPAARPTAREVLGQARRGPRRLAGPAATPPAPPLRSDSARAEASAQPSAPAGPTPAEPPPSPAALGAGDTAPMPVVPSAGPLPAGPAAGPPAPEPAVDPSTRVAGGEETVVTPSPAARARPAPPTPARPAQAAPPDSTIPGAHAAQPVPAQPQPPVSRAPAEPRRQEPRRSRRGPLVLILLAVLLVVVVGVIALRPDGSGDGGTVQPSPTSSPDTSDAPGAPASDQLRAGDWLLASYRTSNVDGRMTLSGTVQNTGDAPASADLTVWIYQGGQPLGSVGTTVSDVPAGGSVEVTMTGDAVWQAGQKVVLLQAS